MKNPLLCLALFTVFSVTGCSSDADSAGGSFQDRSWALTSYQTDSGEVTMISGEPSYTFMFLRRSNSVEAQLPCNPAVAGYTFSDSVFTASGLISIDIPCVIETAETNTAEVFIAGMFDREPLIVFLNDRTLIFRAGNNRELRFATEI